SRPMARSNTRSPSLRRLGVVERIARRTRAAHWPAAWLRAIHRVRAGVSFRVYDGVRDSTDSDDCAEEAPCTVECHFGTESGFGSVWFLAARAVCSSMRSFNAFRA